MNSPVRATADMKADPADATLLRLTHTDTALAEMRRDVSISERPAAGAAPLDIAALRMRDLAERLAETRRDTKPLAILSDTTLSSTDTEILPVSLATIAGLRALRATGTNDDVGATTEALPITGDVIMPVSANVAVVTADPELLPVPLRLATSGNELAPPLLAPTDVEFVTSGAGHLQPADDQIPADIRLVDLIRRQKTLLDQLNSYPSAPLPAVIGPSEPAAPFARSVVDQLAPTPAQIAVTTEPRPALEIMAVDADTVAPTQPSVRPPRLEIAADGAEPELPERSPMIIERARAERSGRLGANDAYIPPSALPAFAAGLTIALAIAGTLFYLI